MVNKVTLTKALGILCVVIGHSGCPDILKNIIYLFHMPLFFFIAGYCFKDKYLNDFKTFFVHRVKGLYFPFLKWTILFILLHNLFFNLNIYNVEYGTGTGLIHYNLKTYLRLLLAALRFNTQEQLLGVFWFLKSLFFGYFIFYFFVKFFKRCFLAIGILIFIIIIILIKDVNIPFLGFRSLYPALFIMLGYLYKKIEYILPEHYSIIAIFIGVTTLIIASLFLKIEMLEVTIITFFPYTMIAFIGCITLLLLSEMLSNTYCFNNGLMAYIGSHTLGIMTLHFLSFKLVTLILINIYGLSIKMLAAFPVITYMEPNNWWILYSFIGISCPLLLYYLCEKLLARLHRSKIQ